MAKGIKYVKKTMDGIEFEVELDEKDYTLVDYVARDCHLCGRSFTIGLDNGETICPKCKDLWKEFVKSGEVR